MVPMAVFLESVVHRITVGSDFLRALLCALPVNILQLPHIHMRKRASNLAAALRAIRGCRFECLGMMFILLFSVFILHSCSAADDLIPVKCDAV